MFSPNKHVRGFTLIELLIVIAIIGILASIVLVSLNQAKVSAEAVRAVSEMKSIKTALQIYISDTEQVPPQCALDCTALTDPFLNSLGVSGWDGPYIDGGIYNRTHRWGGHMGLHVFDHDSDGNDEAWLLLDDDAPGTTSSDDSGTVPANVLERIDKMVDNGDLADGDSFIGAGSGVFVAGEGAWRIQSP